MRWPHISNRRRGPLAAAAALVATALVVTACGGSDDVSTEDCTTVEPDSDGRTVLEVGAESLDFDFDCIEVQAGTVHITFENRDSGVAHNLRVAGQATDLKAGPVVQELTVELDVGDHDVSCDPHPNMKAVIVAA